MPVVLSPPLTINQTLFTERICIRINRGVLAELKKRAAEQGMRYQTFINLLLAQDATP
jgi:predicted DNA binding CopG/RHH family protein